MDTKVLEINLISAQGLKHPPPTTNTHNLQTYAVVWVDPSNKLRTRIDRVGGGNPTWNDKFLFKVTQEFLSGETSGVSFDIFSVGRLRNTLIGSARFLISNLPLISGPTGRTPSFFPLHIQRPSGSFQGVLNIGASVVEDSDLMKGSLAIGYRDLMGESFRKGQNREFKKSNKEKENWVGELSSDSSSSSSSSSSSTKSSNSCSTTSAALKDWNNVRSFSLSRSASSDSEGGGGGGILCGLLTMQRRFSLCLSDQNLRAYSCGSHKEK